MEWFGYVFQTYVEEVKDIEVKQINVSLDNTTMQKGERKALKVQVLPENATDKSLTYTSSNSSVVSIDSNRKTFCNKVRLIYYYSKSQKQYSK